MYIFAAVSHLDESACGSSSANRKYIAVCSHMTANYKALPLLLELYLEFTATSDIGSKIEAAVTALTWCTQVGLV